MQKSLLLVGLFGLLSIPVFANGNPKPNDGHEPDMNFQMATFPGGPADLMNYLAHNLEYPKEARSKAVAGKVRVAFVVGSDGRVFDVEILEGLGYGCDEEARRLIKSLPPWEPARFGDVPVSMYMQLSIRFGRERLIARRS